MVSQKTNKTSIEILEAGYSCSFPFRITIRILEKHQKISAVICFFLIYFDNLSAEKHLYDINLLQIEIRIMKLNFLLGIKADDYEFKIALRLEFCQLVTVEQKDCFSKG